jgi:hypothetical protein
MLHCKQELEAMHASKDDVLHFAKDFKLSFRFRTLLDLLSAI